MTNLPALRPEHTNRTYDSPRPRNLVLVLDAHRTHQSSRRELVGVKDVRSAPVLERKRVHSRSKSEIKMPSDGFLGRSRHSDEPTWFKSQMLSATQTEATKRETLGKPGRSPDDRSLVPGGGFHLSRSASGPTRIGLPNGCPTSASCGSNLAR